MQATPVEMQASDPSTRISEAPPLLFPAFLGSLDKDVSPQISMPSSNTILEVDPTKGYGDVPAMYISESSDAPEEIEESILENPPDNQLSILYEPKLDDWEREVSQLRSLHFFVNNSPANIFNFYELFPNITEQILSLSVSSNGLRHALLATAVVVRDLFCLQPPSEHYFIEKTTSLRYLQEAISNDAVDEALALAVIMHIAMDVCSGTLGPTKRHLRGLYLIYQRLEQRTIDQDGRLSPIAMLIRRMAIRTDQAITSLSEDFPVFLALEPEDEIEDRKWLTKGNGLSKNMTSKDIEWSLASFEMDNLTHRTYTFSKKADIYRTSGDSQAEEKILDEYQKLVRQFEIWRQRTVIREQEDVERVARQMTNLSVDVPRFLWYEPLHLQNLYYAKLLNQWRLANIYALLVVRPVPGPEPHSVSHFQYAVDICRTQAALGKEGYVGPCWHCLFYAGIVFGGSKRYSMESEWTLDMLRSVAIVFPVIQEMVERMPAVWESDRVHWNAFARLWEVNGLVDT
jgi:hypothetical protein